ncbi:MAG: asparaginase domain-containing protein [Planctomycetota bacterium]
MHRVELITTGGTIEKTYDERTGKLANHRSIVDRMLRRLKLPDAIITVHEILSKDSLEFTDADRELILEVTSSSLQNSAPGDDESASVVILHGTDTLPITGEYLCDQLGEITGRVILTGAMRPFEMRRSDALQNLTEAILASRLLWPGVYCVAHGKALRFPGVIKDRQAGTFVSENG